jgi:AdoMet-dependent heme synthase
MSLMQELNQKALRLGIPLSVHLDLTYGCNERCEHCYLDHEDRGEMSTEEIRRLLREMADAGVFFLTLSGGEPLMRRDCFEIIEDARDLGFNVKLKTNAVLIREAEAQRLRALGVEQVQISVYSHRPEVHDAITKLPGSLKRTLEGVRRLRAAGLKVTLANVLMPTNFGDSSGVQSLAAEAGAHYTLDPTITPMMDGETSVLRLRLPASQLDSFFHDRNLVGDVEGFCAPPPPVDDGAREGIPCSAGHTACYVTPYGDVYPCVQFPLACGNIRQQRFIEI